jgi:integrase
LEQGSSQRGIAEYDLESRFEGGGITEGRAADASTDDLAKIAGHTDKKTTARIYDRAQIEAARRVAAARLAHRKKTEK